MRPIKEFSVHIFPKMNLWSTLNFVRLMALFMSKEGDCGHFYRFSISQSTIPQEWLLTPMFLKATNMIGGGVWECVHSILQFFSPLIRLIGSLFYLRMTWLWRIIGVVFKWSRRMRYAVLKNRMGEMIFLLASY